MQRNFTDSNSNVGLRSGRVLDERLNRYIGRSRQSSFV